VGEGTERLTSNSIAEYFAALGRRGREQLLRNARGSARFDVAVVDKSKAKAVAGHLLGSRGRVDVEGRRG
jgi:hypothetical protein